MPQRRATVEQLETFSDAVFAVTITIMVLELKPPEHPTFAALLPLWPTALSYAVTYQFIAIVWLNHHHLLRFTDPPTPRLIWINFGHLLMVSLVPFSTAWVASTRLAAVPVFVYAAVFVLVKLAYLQFEGHVLAQAGVDELSHRARQFAKDTLICCTGNLCKCDALGAQVPILGLRAGILRRIALSLRPEPPGTGEYA